MASLLPLLAAAAVSCGGGPNPQPTPLSGHLTQGEAHVTVSGDLRDEYVVPLDRDAPNIFQPPDGGFAVNWADESARGLGVGGPLFTGARETGQNLSLSITLIQEDLPAVFGSFGGECRITITTVGTDALAGTFSCRHLTKGETTIRAQGDFSAAAT
jgi:hypothetical protein